MTLNAIQMRELDLRRRNPLGQFGQDSKGTTFTVGGKYGCGHTCCQFIAELAGKGKFTHNEISKRAGYPNMSAEPTTKTRRGLSTGEAIKFLASVGIGYHWESNLTLAQMVAHSLKGPVLIVHQYRWWPEWKDYVYMGRKADGKPNGFATPLSTAGANQVGLDLAHWGVLIGEDQVRGVFIEYTWETNHRSRTRPEAVPFDRMTRAQLRNVQISRKGVVLVPDRAL